MTALVVSSQANLQNKHTLVYNSCFNNPIFFNMVHYFLKLRGLLTASLELN